MLAMASNSQDERLQAREERRRHHHIDNLDWSTQASHDLGNAGDDASPALFGPAVKVKYEDTTSQRIKSLFGNVSPAPNHTAYQSPNNAMNRNSQKPPPSSQVTSPLKFNSANSRPYHNTSQTDKILPPPTANPAAAANSINPKHRRKSEQSGKSEQSAEESNSKHKHKEKKKKSHHSDEKSSKKSKSHHRERSSSKDSQSHSSSTAATTTHKLPNTSESKRHRSPSVSSDRSDQSVKSSSKSNAATDKQKNSAYNSSRTSSSSHKNKHSSSKSQQHGDSRGSSTLTSSSTGSGLNHLSNSCANTSKGAQLLHKSGDSQYISNLSSTSSYKIPLNSSSSRTTSSNSSTTTTTASSNSSHKSAFNRPNGLTARSKPTNLVIPTPTKSNSLLDTVSEEKEKDHDVKQILEQMTKLSSQIVLNPIQTPCKPDIVPPYQFHPLKPIEPIADRTSSNSDKKPGQSTAVKSTKGTPKDGAESTSPKKSVTASNGDVGELGLELSDSDSDSGSSSSSSGSDSSSSSSSDSDSSSDEEEKEEKKTPTLFSNLDRSPAPIKPMENQSDTANNENYSLERLMGHVSGETPNPSPYPANQINNNASTTSSSKNLNTGTEPKKRRGRPTKEESMKRDRDPDFQLPKNQPKTITTSFIATGKPKRSVVKSKLSSLSSDEEDDESTLVTSPPISEIICAPQITSTSVDDDEEEDVDVDVDGDVVPNESPANTNNPLTALLSRKFASSRSATSSSKQTVNMGDLQLNRLMTGEPISPVEVENPLLGDTGSVGVKEEAEVASLVFQIPLHVLITYPGAPNTSDTSMPRISPGGATKPVKEEKVSSPAKRKLTPRPRDLLKSKKIKSDIKSEVKSPVDDVLSQPAFTKHATSVMKPSTSSIPPYDGDPQNYHDHGRALKGKVQESSPLPQNRTVRLLTMLDSLIHFMMSAIARERAASRQFKISDVINYYSGTASYSENPEFTRENLNNWTETEKCCHVLWCFAQAHLYLRLYKLQKDRAKAASVKLEEYLSNSKSSVSPHNHATVSSINPTPSSSQNYSQHNNRSRGSPGSPAPSPASVNSTGSMVCGNPWRPPQDDIAPLTVTLSVQATSDSGRGGSIHSQMTVPDFILKDVEQYMKVTKLLSSAYELWKNASIRVNNEHKEFFAEIQEELGYSIDLLTDSRALVHFIHTGCGKLKARASTSNHFS